MLWHRAVIAMTGLVAFSCNEDPEVRAQTVLVIDTDLTTLGASNVVPVAAVDTLHVDVLAGSQVLESRDFVIGSPADLPVSMGLIGAQRVRLRLYRSSLAGVAEVTIDRLVDLPASPSGAVTRKRVLLTGECIGFVADVVNGLSCIGRDTPSAPAASALDDDDGAPTHAGTWAALVPAGCTTGDDPDRRCVLGSYDVIGDLTLADLGYPLDSTAPLRPVVLRPFRMDRTEFTVGRYRSLLASGKAPPALPHVAVAGDGSFAYCSFVSAANADNDNLPLNCVSAPLAREICHAAGGELPTAAQWEHAARGRDGRGFPWGNDTPECCTVSASHGPPELHNEQLECGDAGLEPVGSHVASRDACRGGGDISRDGLLDLVGSLREVTLDSIDNGGMCAPRGLAREPVCQAVAGVGAVVTMGTDFTSGLGRTRAALRGHGGSAGFILGFRCVYPEPPEP